MKKTKKWSLAIVSAIGLAACLNPIDFNPEVRLRLGGEVAGSIAVDGNNTAWLIIRNNTLSLNVVKIEVRDPARQDVNTGEETLVSMVTERPMAGHEKSIALKPKEGEYGVRIWYEEVNPPLAGPRPNSRDKPSWDWGLAKPRPAPPGEPQKTISVALPSRGEYTLHLYRNADGSVGIAKPGEGFTPHPHDYVADANISSSVDNRVEGSVNVTINNGNKDKYGLLIVKNLTSDIDIDRVVFEYSETINSAQNPGRLYTMDPGPGKRDQSSVLLEPLQWKTTLYYTESGGGGTAGTSANSQKSAPERNVIVANNGQVFYLYFYRTKTGACGISPSWPPVPNDAADENADPTDVLGNDQGLLRIINKSAKSIITATKWLDVEYPTELIPEDNAVFVMPAGTGKMQFKIHGGDYGAWFTRTIKRKATTTVVYTDALEQPDYYPANGGLIKLVNHSGARAIAVRVIDPLMSGGFLSIVDTDFIPAGPVGKDGRAGIIVEGKGRFRIRPNKQYLVQVILETGTGRLSVERYEVLYERIVTIVIQDDEVAQNTNHGANITIHNRSDKDVLSLYAANPADRLESLTITSDGFVPSGEIRKGNSAVARIASSPTLPIVRGRSYNVQLTLGPPPYVNLNRKLELYDRNIEIWITQVEVDQAGGGSGGGSGAGGVFVPVTNIGGVPSTVTTGQTITLSGTVDPADATKKDIIWSIKKTTTTNAAITNTNEFRAGSVGTVTVVATVPGGGVNRKDYTQEFTIQVTATAPAFIPVTNISGVPQSVYQNADHTFYAVVSPGDATKKTPINWQVLSGGANVRDGGGGALVLHVSSATPAKLRATIPGGGAGRQDYIQDFTVTPDSGPTIIDGGGGSSGGSGTIRFVKENDGSSPVFAAWIYTMDSRYDNKFNNSHLASGNSGIAVDGAFSYFHPPAGLTLYREVSNLYTVMVNKGDYYELNLPRGRYLITWLKTSSALHYGYDKQNWFVLDMPYHSGKSPIEIKVDTTGPDCTMRF